jgi:hypothetical protein
MSNKNKITQLHPKLFIQYLDNSIDRNFDIDLGTELKFDIEYSSIFNDPTVRFLKMYLEFPYLVYISTQTFFTFPLTSRYSIC